jgi:hypothetical protein
VLVFDIDNGHRFVKRIPLAGYGVDAAGKPLNVKGVCANAGTGRLYVSTLQNLICVDLVSEKVLWQKSFDRGAVTGVDHEYAAARRFAVVGYERASGDHLDTIILGTVEMDAMVAIMFRARGHRVFFVDGMSYEQHGDGLGLRCAMLAHPAGRFDWKFRSIAPARDHVGFVVEPQSVVLA